MDKKVVIRAIPIKVQDLEPGDLFSSLGQQYWGTVDLNLSLGEKLYIRTNSPPPLRKDIQEKQLFKIEIERSEE